MLSLLAELLIFLIYWQRDSKLNDPHNQMGSMQEVCFLLCFIYLYLCSASLCMQPDIWTPPWAKGMNLTSKGKAETEADQDDFSTDRTSSKHLAQTLF